MSRQLLARASCAVVLIGFALQGNAASYDNSGNSDSAASKVEFGFDVNVERQHQEFDDNSADLTTVSFAPRLTYGNWEASLDLPWQHAEGGYFVNSNLNLPPKLDQLVESSCSFSANRSAAYYAAHPKLAALNQKCISAGVTGSEVDDSVSGLGDATLSLHYGLPLDADGVWLLSVGGNYKFDNGDYDKNLGSGTRNAMLDASLGVSYGWFVGSINAGYAWVSATDAADTKSNYTYGSVDAGIRPWDWLTLGCNWSSDESYYAGGETVEKTTVYVRVKPFDHLGLKVYASNYGSTEGYPDREYGASIYYSY
jgi:hypothetical protein